MISLTEAILFLMNFKRLFNMQGLRASPINGGIKAYGSENGCE